MIKSAEFKKSISTIDGYIEDAETFSLPEIAVAGKSNVGKSSFINMITSRKHLAKTSSTPGRTRLINLFDINKGEFLLVDLPGYGYAKASLGEKEKFSKLTDSYFNKSTHLCHVFSLIDIRHEPSNLDMQMIGYLFAKGIPFTIVATKADKLSKAQQNRQIIMLASALKVGRDNILVSSSLNGQGKIDIEKRIEQILENIK